VAAAIPVRILNSHDPDQPGTLITGQGVHRRHPLAGLAARSSVTVLHVRSRSTADRTLILAKLAAAGDDSGVAIHMATSTDTGVALAIDASEGVDEVAALAATIGEVERHDHLAIIAAVGDGLRRSPLLCAATLRALEGIPLHLAVHAPDSCHLAVVVSESRVARALSQLHARFFEGERSHPAVDGWHPSAGRRSQGAGATTHTSPTAASQETRA
jgi:aspartokinase